MTTVQSTSQTLETRIGTLEFNHDFANGATFSAPVRRNSGACRPSRSPRGMEYWQRLDDVIQREPVEPDRRWHRSGPGLLQRIWAPTRTRPASGWMVRVLSFRPAPDPLPDFEPI